MSGVIVSPSSTNKIFIFFSHEEQHFQQILFSTMKLLLITALISSSAAFAPAATGRKSVALQGSSSSAIEAALAASKKFGPTSKEAAVLWDIVEEMDASDNRWVVRIVLLSYTDENFHVERETERSDLFHFPPLTTMLR